MFILYLTNNVLIILQAFCFFFFIYIIFYKKLTSVTGNGNTKVNNATEKNSASFKF